MKKFLLSSIVFTLLLFVSFYAIFLKANGKADPYYVRFTTPKQQSLILGSSRAAQGIQPAVLNKNLARTDIFNYAFSINLSPYGPAYLQSIKNKLSPENKKGIFIITVDPWSVCSVNEDPDNILKFKETGQALGKVKYVSQRPNIPYLIQGFDQHYWELIFSNSNTFLHKDGWLEVTVPMDSVSLIKRRERKIKEYTEQNLAFNKFSKLRLDYLVQTINFLKERGTVYLVRLPMHPSIMKIEQDLMPDFPGKLGHVIKETGVGFYDMTPLNDKYIYTDGNHLYKKSGKKVSEDIATWILAQNG